MRRFFIKYGFDATIVCILLSIVAVVALPIYQNHRAEETLGRLMNGDRDIEITQFVIEGQQRRIICDDAEICIYVSNAFTESILDDSSSGNSYHSTFRMNGLDVWVECTYFLGGIGLSIPADDPWEIGIPTRSIYFRGEVPTKLTQMWEFLAAPLKEVSGKVMHVPDDGEPYFTFDQSIWDPN